jgi:Ca2+-binding RTX toxin-like protein
MIAAATTALSLVAAVPAYAAGASQANSTGSTLYVQAASGTVNTFHMFATASNFTVYDSTAPLQLDRARSGGCTQPSASVIVCPLGISRVFYTLGDGNDRIQNDTDRELTVYGGTGNDTVLGGSAADEMDGQGGEDWLEGRGGNDYVAGGDDNDDLYGGDGGDRMQGLGADIRRSSCEVA